METYHIKWTEQLRAGYNTLYKQMSGGQVVMFANLITKQTRLNTKYGMLDPRYERCLGDLMTTFYSRTFKNIMPLVLQVIERMKTEYYKEKDTICLSHGPVDLFKFVNEIVDISMHCPCEGAHCARCCLSNGLYGLGHDQPDDSRQHGHRPAGE